MRDLVIFRQNLFRVSEPFITEQGGRLERYRPVYLGRLRFGAAPVGARSLALADEGRWRSWPKIGWQVLSRSSTGYRRLLGDIKPSLIHAHFGIDGVYALPLAERLGIPLVTTFHGFDATLSTAAMLSSPAWMNYPLFRRQLARRGQLFLCVSSYIRERVLGMGFPAERTHVHYTGVDCTAIQPRDPEEETGTILHVARLVEMKGTRYLLLAFAELIQLHPAVTLVIIGDGELRRPLQKLARSLNLGDRVRFLGALPHAQALAWMHKAAMLVLPSVRTNTGRVEGLGMVLLEAAATGLPVVASRVGGIAEGVLDGETGYLVPQRDSAALCQRMSDLLQQTTVRRQMGARARMFVQANYDIVRQSERLERLYDSVLTHRNIDER